MSSPFALCPHPSPFPEGEGALLLSFASLLNDPTKLAKAKFFVSSQQLSFRIQNPVVTPAEILDLALAAPKKFTQKAFRPIAIDRLANRFRRGRHPQTMLAAIMRP